MPAILETQMAWSDGEVSLGLVIGTTHGKLVIDGPICYYGCPTVPVELKIEGGRIVEVVGGDAKICKETPPSDSGSKKTATILRRSESD